METFEFTIPSVENIEIGDVVVVNKKSHALVLAEDDQGCSNCSLLKYCSGLSFCGNNINAIFKKNV